MSTAPARTLRSLFSLAATGALALALGCSEPPSDAQPDAGTMTPADMSSAGDMTPAVKPRCELPFDQRAIAQVSTGLVTVTQSPGDPSTWNGEIDATAGGSMAFDKNPFIYVDLIKRTKVDLNDVQAQTSKEWDLAFKRWQIKINSGDSGPGGVTVARVAGKSLSEVTTAPADNYSADTYFDDKCMLALDPIGGIATALSDWYGYDMVTSRLTPNKEVLVLPRRDGQGHIKVQITAYYKANISGNFSLSWSYLP